MSPIDHFVENIVKKISSQKPNFHLILVLAMIERNIDLLEEELAPEIVEKFKQCLSQFWKTIEEATPNIASPIVDLRKLLSNYFDPDPSREGFGQTINMISYLSAWEGYRSVDIVNMVLSRDLDMISNRTYASLNIYIENNKNDEVVCKQPLMQIEFSYIEKLVSYLLNERKNFTIEEIKRISHREFPLDTDF
jgi:hypothetical protein